MMNMILIKIDTKGIITMRILHFIVVVLFLISYHLIYQIDKLKCLILILCLKFMMNILNLLINYIILLKKFNFIKYNPYICTMKKYKKIVFVDMDGVLCDFYKAYKQAIIDNPSQKYPQSQWGFFLRLEEIKGAIEGFRKLEEKYDVYILTRPSFRNINCYTEKIQWVCDHLGYDIVEKTFMGPDKSFLKGDYLIDDMGNAGQEEFEGEWIHFGTDRFSNWDLVVEYLMNK